ncbi:MAG: cereblon family protein [Solidesulfovibrio sp.]|uniref:cereblon family protein n=1 Tax=Solidesulfovibrio sp. TaxID=2910990 RepID=UPI00315913F6
MDKHLTLFATTPPIVLSWDEADEETPVLPEKPVLTNTELAKGDRFVCAQCGADVTRASHRIAVAGSHRHRMPGPHGLAQEVGLFSLAPGCTPLGHFALDFSTPSDGQWQMGICAICGNHLGWHHQSADGIGFYGLILDHLALADDEAGEADTA